MAKDNYTKLHELSRTTAVFSSVYNLLEWDQETYMPSGTIPMRSLQTEAMASFIHKQKTSPRFAKLLGRMIDLQSGAVHDKQLGEPQKAALREWRRDYLLSVKLPSNFVKKFAKTTSEAIHAWAKARKANNFKEFAPHLDKIVALSRKKADLLGYADHPYDALLDLFEPGMKTRALLPLFDKLKGSLTALVKEISARPQPKCDFLEGHFPPSKQLHFAHEVLQAMGFDMNSSRLDQSAHPFCMSIAPKDTRMTTHIHADQLTPSIFAVIHEGGHGLYHAGLPEEQFGSPLGEAISLGIDESQSRWWETLIGQSLPFWRYFYPKLQQEFHEKLAAVSLDEFYRAVNIVEPSFIRIHADEVTYSLHIIVRFELEKALIEGALKVKDLPEAWNEKMRAYLGIVPKNDAEGCLQDIHWSMGALGYFPTYTLGNLYASQFFATFEKTYPDWKERVAAGDLGFIRKWLKEEIHQHGRRFTAEELCTRITGKPLSEEYYLSYLQKKYKSLYS